MKEEHQNEETVEEEYQKMRILFNHNHFDNQRDKHVLYEKGVWNVNSKVIWSYFFLFKFPKFKNEMDQLKKDGKIPVEIDERNLIKISVMLK